MIECPTTSNIQKIELNCKKKLEIFANKLNRHSNTLRKNVSELQQIAGSVAAKSQQLQRLETSDSDVVKIAYSEDQRNYVLGEVIAQMNTSMIAANRLIKELLILHDELESDYQNLLAASNVLQTLTDKGAVLLGDSKQRPILYYIDEACQLLYAWCCYQKLLEHSLTNVNIRDNDSFKEFSQLSNLPTSISIKLDEYLLYCAFILTTK